MEFARLPEGRRGRNSHGSLGIGFMTQFSDALHLVQFCESKLPELREQHAKCLEQQSIEPVFLIGVKNYMENLRSALDYCALGLFEKYGSSKKKDPKIYFPYAKAADDKTKFRNEIVERCIPGITNSRPDVVDRLESYQYFGNTGNWLPLLAEITNEHKHEQLTPQVQKEYRAVLITATIPPGGTVEIDLTKIPLGSGPDKPFHAVAGKWVGLEFTSTGVLVLPLLEHSLPNVRRIVEELSAL